MSDYIPTPGGPFDPNRDHNRYDNLNYVASGSTTGVYVFVGVLVVAVLAAGFLFFSGPPSDRNDQARLPDTTMTSPADRAPAGR